MKQDQKKPLRLFVDPFAAWRELAFKTAEMIAASVHAGAARASSVRVAVIDERERPAQRPAERPRPSKASARKKHKKRAKRR